jgi:hypothetical protein
VTSTTPRHLILGGLISATILNLLVIPPLVCPVRIDGSGCESSLTGHTAAGRYRAARRVWVLVDIAPQLTSAVLDHRDLAR